MIILIHNFVNLLFPEFIPKSCEEALLVPTWKHAMNNEMDALASRGLGVSVMVHRRGLGRRLGGHRDGSVLATRISFGRYAQNAT